VARESLHSHAIQYQVDSQWGRGHRHSGVAVEYIRGVPLDLPYSRRIALTTVERSIQKLNAEHQIDIATLADICPKEHFVKTSVLLVVAITLGASAFAQTPAAPSLYRTITISRTVEAVNYEHQGGATKVDFAGTALMPSASGWAKVESKRGNLQIAAEFGNLQKPTMFGNEYLTYILWAITPEGRPVNLGEVLVGGNDRSKIHATTNLQSFALIVTAEPYYAVRQPSDVVVLENVIRADTQGTSEAVNAKYELTERGGYIPTGYKFDPVVLNAKLPLEFFEARNAVRIAQSEGAEQYATDSYQHALQLMNVANGYAVETHPPSKELIATSREAVQTAEDARSIAVKKMDEARLSSERQATADAQAESQAKADAADRQKLTAEVDAAQAQAKAAKAQSDMVASQAASSAAVAEAQADADQARSAAQQANTDKAAMRARLSDQLNAILQTRDSARGLIVSMSDVLFDTGKYSLKPGAREKLAKVAGILIAYPGLAIEIDGYTDNVGGDATNQVLSENRARSVRDYLVQEGVMPNAVTAIGYGDASPVASNQNAGGRQQNRRVELVVSGAAIGDAGAVTTGSLH
jgi:outer membrane protein OmpA-like peptidoglycan-associated protein